MPARSIYIERESILELLSDDRPTFRHADMTHVKFRQPPVTEVVFSVSFTLDRPLKMAHFGLFWERIRAEFPRIEDNPPLPGVIQPSSDPMATQQIEFMLLPPLRRVWFLDKEGRDVIQIQDDRFIFNWKRNPSDPGYPGFDEVNRRFEQHLGAFTRFLSDEGFGTPNYTFLELIYVNHLDHSNGLGHLQAGNVLVDHQRDTTRERFLPEPAAFNWLTQYAVTGGMGMLQVHAQTVAQVGGTPAMRLDVAARGAPATPAEDERLRWFQVAHEWATQGFTDTVVASLLDERWGRV